MSSRVTQIEDLLTEFILKEKDYKKIILAGHSLGGYTSSILVRDSQVFRERLAGALIICPAIKFPYFFHKFLNPEQLESYNNGEIVSFEFKDIPNYLSLDLVKESKGLTFGEGQKEFDFDFPVNLFWGDKDKLVPLAFKDDIISNIKGGDKHDKLTITMSDDGDHFLNRPEDLERMEKCILEMLGK